MTSGKESYVMRGDGSQVRMNILISRIHKFDHNLLAIVRDRYLSRRQLNEIACIQIKNPAHLPSCTRPIDIPLDAPPPLLAIQVDAVSYP